MDDNLGALVEVLDDGVVVLQAPSTAAGDALPSVVVCCNSAARRILGLAGEIVGHPFDYACAGDDAGRLADAVRAAPRSGGIARLSLTPANELSAAAVEARIAALPQGVAVVLRSREPAESERAASEFERKMACAARVCGRVGHDMNNLLTGVLGYAELAEDCLDDDSPAREHLVHVMESVDRAAAFNADLLAMASREVVAPSSIDLATFLPASGATMAEAAGGQVDVQVTVPAGPLVVFADASRLRRALTILASNAGRAMGGTGALRVSAERRRIPERSFDGTARLDPGDYVCISVTDTGEGLSPGVEPRLFEPFFTTQVHVKSAGVGLGVLHGIVRQAGGTVVAHGEPGAGATFRVYLPAIVTSP